MVRFSIFPWCSQVNRYHWIFDPFNFLIYDLQRSLLIHLFGSLHEDVFQTIWWPSAKMFKSINQLGWKFEFPDLIHSFNWGNRGEDEIDLILLAWELDHFEVLVVKLRLSLPEKRVAFPILNIEKINRVVRSGNQVWETAKVESLERFHVWAMLLTSFEGWILHLPLSQSEDELLFRLIVESY